MAVASAGATMPINRLLKDTPFGPDQIKVLNEAYDTALRSLYLVDRNDPMTEIVARKVIELGQSGLRDPAQIAALAVNALGCGPNPPS
jgi:hypothetical protein